MTTDWTFQEHPGYLAITTTGRASSGPEELTRTLQWTEDALNTATEHSITAILVDRRQSPRRPDSIAGDVFLYSVINTLAERGYARQFHRIAILTTEEGMGNATYVEDLAQNRGLNMHFFTDEAEATTWLTA